MLFLACVNSNLQRWKIILIGEVNRFNPCQTVNIFDNRTRIKFLLYHCSKSWVRTALCFKHA